VCYVSEHVAEDRDESEDDTAVIEKQGFVGLSHCSQR
jgi:hypothetical protein